MEEKLSPAIQLISLVWEKSFSAKPHSWVAYNNCLQTALSLAIKSGMDFYLNDFQYIADNFQFGFWGGEYDGFGERFYFHAVRDSNIKAAQSFENWKKRKPFIFDNISHSWIQSFKKRKQCRIFAGAQFTWNCEKVAVTSFAENGKYFIACSYHEKKDGEFRQKVKRRYKITHADIKRARAENKMIEKVKVGFEAGFSRKTTNFYSRVAELFRLSFGEYKSMEVDFYRMLAGLSHSANKQ